MILTEYNRVMSETVIKVENLSKQYRLGLVGSGTIKDDFNRWWAKIRGKEDPFLKIGEVNDRSAKGASDYVWSLKDINFEVNKGEVLGIIGKNGAGKSTLLKILSRVTSPTTGSVKVKGRIASLLEVGTGFHPELTGIENIFLNGAILGMKKHEIKAKFDEIVAFAGIERYIDTPVKRYSSGMYVRLAFAVAAHLEPEILIVDEVLAVGDAEFQKKCLGKMKDVAGQGRTVLFVSHNMRAISNLCTQTILLDNGTILDSGETLRIIDIYNEKFEINETRINRNVSWKNQYIDISEIKINDLKVSEIKLFVNEKIKVGFYFNLFFEHHNVRISVNLKSSDDLLIFSIPSPPIKQGLNNLTLEIPANLLNNQNYIIDVDVSYFEDVYVHHLFKLNNVINLSLNDVHDSFVKKVFTGTWSGLLRQDFKWY
jgi:lipopolysaccharide transport system ATP-binding protein